MSTGDFLPASRPRLADLKSCEEWLAKATLADPRQACTALLTLLDELEDAPPRHTVYLQILERLRRAILSTLDEHAKRFSAKPVPLSPGESADFTQVCDLWVALLRSYRRLLNAALKGSPPGLEPSLTLLCHRVLGCSAELIGVYFLARRDLAADLWRGLHEMYSLAEGRGIAGSPVADDQTESTCTGIYVRPLLLQIANPYGLSPRKLVWARRWIERWSEKVKLESQVRENGGYGVDLAGDAGAAWAPPVAGAGESDKKTGPLPPVAESWRYFDLGDLGRSFRQRIRKLEERVEPGELGLGTDCDGPGAIELLRALLHAWLAAPKARQFPRRAGPAQTELVSGLAAIHHIIGGKLLGNEAKAWDYSRRDTEQIVIFQRALEVAAKQEQTQNGPAAEVWEALDESATGFRLRRTEAGARLAHRQLVAVRPRGARQFILGEIRWLTQGADQAVTVGIHALPGLARAGAARPIADDPTRPGAFSQALISPAAAGFPPTLLLPAGWYQNGRMLELLLDSELVRVRLTILVGRGLDYDRVQFAAAVSTPAR